MSSSSFDVRSLTSLFENNVTTISITLQYGSQREVVAFERTASPEVFQSFQNRARAFAEKQSAPLGPGIEMHLYQHDYNSVNFLQLITNLSQLGNGSVVEIIVVDKNEQPTQPHELRVAQYMTPTFCDYCGEVIMGMIKQGFKCKRCKCNFHKRCTNAPRNNCASAAPSTPSDSVSHTSGTLPHTLSMHSYKVPTVCRVCDGLLVGLVRQGLRCRDCQVNVHKRCATQLPMNCRLANGAITPRFDQLSFADGVSMASAESVEPDAASGSLLPLGRLPGQASSRFQNRSPSAEGWVVHFVLTEPDRRLRHYWVLANGVISMYNEYNDGVNPSRVYKQISLSEILSIICYYGDPIDANFAPHFFEMKTNANVTYCVGENFDAFGGAPPPSKLPRHANSANQSVTNIQAWFQVLTRARLPPPSRQDQPNAEPSLDFTELYQVLSDNTLGSGQFGTVYGAVHRQSGRGVAVKIIAKDRFQRRPGGVENLKSEVTILQTVSHPGIIRLEAMFETKDKIFVVMEKMNGDMLEMILSQATGRLSERATRFLLVQILSALRYLHSHNVAHCDLKPENVLLSDLGSNFPQTKLCDFGYARFIGDAQFRQTIVGTPAYLAPEVLQRKGYNRSLDMWSVGVIIYVTLSGTFPFNDNEEVAEQIQNADFMFPQDPWGQISTQAVDLIQHLLRLRIDERLTIEQCFAHDWLQGHELYSDLRNLETRLGFGRYLTTEADDEKYAQMQIG
ncbi:hypothetical protein QR680_009407 [Steinernema hermaphroditum]|uniref:protein kinase C n=1 Tax=Steinernema hermaphroditum TaxID=289476 RepID=A0AA39ILX6_9BILA|nr:hypothetical protein QR680_009407 [Steinernema hermaphroditum]